MKRGRWVGTLLLVAISCIIALLITGCEPYFQMTISNRTQEELNITVQINPPYGELFDLGVLAPSKTIKKTEVGWI
jgi:hypothetical protein